MLSANTTLKNQAILSIFHFVIFQLKHKPGILEYSFYNIHHCSPFYSTFCAWFDTRFGGIFNRTIESQKYVYYIIYSVP